jgi:hypothetical protein
MLTRSIGPRDVAVVAVVIALMLLGEYAWFSRPSHGAAAAPPALSSIPLRTTLPARQAAALSTGPFGFVYSGPPALEQQSIAGRGIVAIQRGLLDLQRYAAGRLGVAVHGPAAIVLTRDETCDGVSHDGVDAKTRAGETCFYLSGHNYDGGATPGVEELAAHEGAHLLYFELGCVAQLAPWVREGMAVVLGERAVHPDYNYSQLFAAVGDDRHLVLDEQGNPTRVTYGLAAIDMLQAESDHPEAMIAFCLAVAGGEDPEAASRQHLHIQSLASPG